tara:strand:+ start:293 stop:907 length:615 start_codon:yes stop_codon:yes gene_type:complete
MYKIDNKIIADFLLASPDNLVRGYTFVLLSIQQPTQGLADKMLEVDQQGPECRHLNYGLKRAGFEYVEAQKQAIFERLTEYAAIGLNDVDNIAKALHYVYQTPNLGMVKAAFLLQLLGFNVACLDSHNLKRLGWKQSQVSITKGLKYETKIKKIKAYISTTQQKGTAFWWDSWCHYVAGNIANKKLTTGQQVSQYHIQAILPKA